MFAWVVLAFDDLAAALDGGSFVIATKVNDDGYPRIDLREDVFPDLEAETTEEGSEDWEPGDDLPDDDPAADANNPLMKK